MYSILALIDGSKPFGVAVNALAHACVGMGAKLQGTVPDAAAHGTPADETRIRIIRCTREQLRKYRDRASSGGFAMVDFTHTMTSDTYIEQLARTKDCAPENLEYYAVVIAGDPARLDEAFPAQHN